MMRGRVVVVYVAIGYYNERHAAAADAGDGTGVRSRTAALLRLGGNCIAASITDGHDLSLRLNAHVNAASAAACAHSWGALRP